MISSYKSNQFRDKSNDKAMRLYLKEVSKIPLLTADEEKELGRRIQEDGDREALQKMTESNLRFVIKIAKKYRKSGIPLLDLINQGNLGLIEAAKRFDPDRNIRFTSYAVWWIRQSILQFLSEASHPFRISSRTANVLYRVGTALAKKKGDAEEPSREALASEIGVSINELNNSLAATAGTLSLEHSIDASGELMLGDTLEQTMVPSAEDTVIANHLLASVDRSLSLLSPMESLVLRLRFGFDNEDPMTLKEIGAQVNLSRERIRQIEAQALQKLRKSSAAESLATYLN